MASSQGIGAGTLMLYTATLVTSTESPISGTYSPAGGYCASETKEVPASVVKAVGAAGMVSSTATLEIRVGAPIMDLPLEPLLADWPGMVSQCKGLLAPGAKASP